MGKAGAAPHTRLCGLLPALNFQTFFNTIDIFNRFNLIKNYDRC